MTTSAAGMASDPAALLATPLCLGRSELAQKNPPIRVLQPSLMKRPAAAARPPPAGMPIFPHFQGWSHFPRMVYLQSGRSIASRPSSSVMPASKSHYRHSTMGHSRWRVTDADRGGDEARGADRDVHPGRRDPRRCSDAQTSAAAIHQVYMWQYGWLGRGVAFDFRMGREARGRSSSWATSMGCSRPTAIKAITTSAVRRWFTPARSSGGRV